MLYDFVAGKYLSIVKFLDNCHEPEKYADSNHI